MTLAGFAAKNAFRNKRRGALTVLSIAFSLLLLTLLMCVWRVFYLSSGTPADARRLVTRNRISLTFPLPAYYEAKIRAVPGVLAVAPSNWFGGTYKDNTAQNFFGQMGTDPDEILKVFPDYKIAAAEAAAWRRDRGGCIVDQRLAARYGWKLGDHIFLTGTIYPVTLDLTVDGVYESPDSFPVIYFNQEYINQALPSMANENDTYDVLVDSPGRALGAARAIDALFANSPQETRTESAKSFALGFISTLGNIKAFILSIALAVVFAILLVTANTMAMSVRERTREVAVLKTLGFTRGQVLSLFVGEAVVIAVAGGALGAVIAALLLQGAAHSPGGAMMGNVAVTPGIFAVAVGVAALMGFFSGFVPAYRAAAETIVGGLRHIG